MQTASINQTIPPEISIIYLALHSLYDKGYEPSDIFKQIEELSECNKVI
jgi:hypothetical protein